MKLIVFAVLAFAIGANAYCPNLCSGHGTCGAFDKCTCYTQKGTSHRFTYSGSGVNAYGQSAGEMSTDSAWTGADCSQRTCAWTDSWGQVERTKLGATASVDCSAGCTSIDAGTTGDFDGLDAAGQWVTLAAGTDPDYTDFCVTQVTTAVSGDTVEIGSCTIGAGAAVYQVYTGTFHGYEECGGQGSCDRKTGLCECNDAYEGEACARQTCPNDCSGHGICLSQYRIHSDGGESYTAWDALKHQGCSCDPGFRGPDCSLMECASHFDPLRTLSSSASATEDTHFRDCSGRGLCDYASGMCECFSGFYGEACESQTILM